MKEEQVSRTSDCSLWGNYFFLEQDLSLAPPFQILKFPLPLQGSGASLKIVPGCLHRWDDEDPELLCW